MWIKSIVIITVSVIVLFGITSLYGRYQWQLETDRLRAQLTNGKQTINPKTYDSKELEGLPTPVQRFFQTVLKPGQPIVAAVRLSQQGIFNMSETANKWSPFTATQIVTTQRPGFDWDARIQMAPSVRAFVHDAYALGAGSLHASLLGLFTVADVRGTPAAAQGELLRFFAEMPWYPTALLPSQGVRWESIDDTSARATLTDALTTVSLVFRFNAEGTGIEAYATSFNNLQMVNFIPVILLAPTVIVLMACIHYITPESKRVFTLIGIAFSCVYAAIICTNYFLQLYVVRLNLLSGTLDGITLLAVPNFHSIFFALETYGYAFLSLATLFVSPVFSGGKLEGWIRSLFILSGALGIFGAIAAPFDRPYLIFAGLGLWCLAFPLSTILLSIYFKKALNSKISW